MYVSLIKTPQYKISRNFIHWEPIFYVAEEMETGRLGEAYSRFSQLFGEGT